MRTCMLQTHSAVNQDLFRLTLPNHTKYADRHGYDMVHLHRTYDEVWWGWESLVLGLLTSHDAVLTIGSDVLFTDMETPLCYFDDETHGVFVQEEGLGYPCVNFDLVLWTRNGAQQVIERLRETRPAYVNHRFGSQTGMTMLAKDPAMRNLIKVYPPQTMQGAPFCSYAGSWKPGVFALHFLGMSNEKKYEGCKKFLETGEIDWRRR